MTVRPVAFAVAAICRSCAPRGCPERRVCARSEAWWRAHRSAPRAPARARSVRSCRGLVAPRIVRRSIADEPPQIGEILLRAARRHQRPSVRPSPCEATQIRRPIPAGRGRRARAEAGGFVSPASSLRSRAGPPAGCVHDPRPDSSLPELRELRPAASGRRTDHPSPNWPRGPVAFARLAAKRSRSSCRSDHLLLDRGRCQPLRGKPRRQACGSHRMSRSSLTRSSRRDCAAAKAVPGGGRGVRLGTTSATASKLRSAENSSTPPIAFLPQRDHVGDERRYSGPLRRLFTRACRVVCA